MRRNKTQCRCDFRIRGGGSTTVFVCMSDARAFKIALLVLVKCETFHLLLPAFQICKCRAIVIMQCHTQRYFDASKLRNYFGFKLSPFFFQAFELLDRV